MWKEVSTRHLNDIPYEEVKQFLESNPVESFIDLEDSQNSDLTIRRFVKKSRRMFEICFIECDKRFLKQMGQSGPKKD